MSALDPASAMRVTLAPFGEDGVLVELPIAAASYRAARTLAAAEALRSALPGADVVVGAGAVLVVGASRAEVEAATRDGLASSVQAAPSRLHTIAAVYDGPDLGAVAATLGMTEADVVALHAGTTYRAELLGFLPGFAYLGPLPARLVMPRRASPRLLVAAHSVGIAADFTGVYPFASPGGWNLIGRALGFDPFEADREPPSLVQPGDRVRFIPSEGAPSLAAVRSIARSPLEASREARGLFVRSATPGVTIQDLGRIGRLASGLPPSGPLDPEAFAAVNAAVGNPSDAAAVEIPLGAIEVEARGALRVSIDGEPAVALADGESLHVPTASHAVRYLAVRGGIDVPRVLGSRATLLVAKLGGLQGRSLARGDFLPAGDEVLCGVPHAARAHFPLERRSDAHVTIALPSRHFDASAPIAIDPGPHLALFPNDALDTLLGTPWHVSRLGNRVGVRLEGGRVPRDGDDLALPLPMRRGAIQIATDGTPIVLGPDHPATGGYPVLALVRQAFWGVLARLRPGDAVRFRLA